MTYILFFIAGRVVGAGLASSAGRIPSGAAGDVLGRLAAGIAAVSPAKMSSIPRSGWLRVIAPRTPRITR